nr:Ldh family oxidoreductase [Pseudoalteromonas sp. XMcav2-N]
MHNAVVRCLKQYDLPPTDAGIVADSLLFASVRGVDTHGIALLPTYLRELQGGRANRRANMTESAHLPATSRLDADGALGILAGHRAMNLAVEKANTFGIGAVSVGNSNHFGAAGYFSFLAAQQGLIGLSFSNADALMAPDLGCSKVLGTNPLACCIRAQGDEYFHLDMATSQIAFSKVKQHLAHGLPLPQHWVVNGIDHATLNNVILKPLGGYKGQGIATLVQILSALLADMPTDTELSHLFTEPFDTPRQVGHFFIAIKVNAFLDESRFRARLSTLMAEIRRSRALEAQQVLVPGDKEHQAQVQRHEQGIPLDEEVVKVLAPYLDVTDFYQPT